MIIAIPALHVCALGISRTLSWCSKWRKHQRLRELEGPSEKYCMTTWLIKLENLGHTVAPCFCGLKVSRSRYLEESWAGRAGLPWLRREAGCDGNWLCVPEAPSTQDWGLWSWLILFFFPNRNSISGGKEVRADWWTSRGLSMASAWSIHSQTMQCRQNWGMEGKVSAHRALPTCQSFYLPAFIQCLYSY